MPSAKMLLVAALAGAAGAATPPLPLALPQVPRIYGSVKPPATATTPVVVASPPPAVSGNQTIVTTTRVVSEFTTFCPGPTEVSVGDKVYTVTEKTVLTITDCPCTIVEPCLTCAVVPSTSGPVSPPQASSEVPGTQQPVQSEAPVPVPVPTEAPAPAPPVSTGRPTKVPVVVSGAGVRRVACGLALAGGLLAL